MTTRTIAPVVAVSNHLARRGFLASMSLLAASAAAATAAAQPEPQPGPAPASIVAMATRIKTIVDREHALDVKGLANLTPDEDLEEGRLYDERIVLQDAIVASLPGNPTEAVIVLMHAVDRINFGSWHENCDEIIKRGERAVRGATFVLSRDLGVNLGRFGGDGFLPDYMCPIREGEA